MYDATGPEEAVRLAKQNYPEYADLRYEVRDEDGDIVHEHIYHLKPQWFQDRFDSGRGFSSKPPFHTMLDTRQIRALAKSNSSFRTKLQEAILNDERRKKEAEMPCEVRFTYELHKYVGQSEVFAHSFKRSIRRDHFAGVAYLGHHELEIEARKYGISQKRKGFEPFAGKKYIELSRIDIVSTETNETLFMEQFKEAEL